MRALGLIGTYSISGVIAKHVVFLWGVAGDEILVFNAFVNKKHLDNISAMQHSKELKEGNNLRWQNSQWSKMFILNTQ